MLNGLIVEKGNVNKHYKNGLLHCEFSPAIESPDGIHSWYIEGKFIASEIREGNTKNTIIYFNGEEISESPRPKGKTTSSLTT